MFFLEILDTRGNWSSEIGDYNHFDSVEEVEEAIALLNADYPEHDNEWRISDENNNTIKIVE